jgi:molybdate transport system ATP-binding protein
MDSTHYAILIDSKSEVKVFVNKILEGDNNFGLIELKDKNGQLFSDYILDYFINKEEKHGLKIITRHTEQSLISMSSGERKKILLKYLLTQSPDYLILFNPFDNLDSNYQKELKKRFIKLSKTITLIQIISRKEDVLPIPAQFGKLNKTEFIPYKNREDFLNNKVTNSNHFLNHKTPEPLQRKYNKEEILVAFTNVSVSFNKKPILSKINWQINSGDFWQLKGPNGSGKTTLLSMITGDSNKGYGQDLVLFGSKKGSGESVWDIKENIGYFTPSLTDKFKGYHTLENMLISGFHDSIGLYIKPTNSEKKVAQEWLKLLGFTLDKNTYFHQLSVIEKRLIMLGRAMVKHPPLLLIDEATAGLDDYNSSLFVALVNKVAKESNTAIIFVSHREEQGLKANKIFNLIPNENGSIGIILD